jgi:flagellar motility protein MotE (MotC chaperone)
MRWIVKPIMRPIARRKLKELYERRKHIEASIQRARRSKSRVSDLYSLAQQTNADCLRWERWS